MDAGMMWMSDGGKFLYQGFLENLGDSMTLSILSFGSVGDDEVDSEAVLGVSFTVTGTPG